MLWDIQTGVNLSNPSVSRKVLSVIQAVITHWTAHYRAYRRLLDLLYALQILARHERERGNQPRIIVGDAVSCRRAAEMLVVIEDPVFWHTLAK